MRCSRCGNENSSTNRFCGMCGAPLLAPPPAPAGAPGAATGAAAQAAGARDVMAQAPAGPRTAAPAAKVPAIAGPSFLGLNQVPSGRSSSLRGGSHLEKSSGNLDYLLEDEEESKGGPGKIFLVLVVLALGLGYGYLRWRHVELSSLFSGTQTSGSQKSSPSAATGDEAQTGSGSAPLPTDSSPSPSANPAPADGSAQPAAQPAPNGAAGAGNPPAANAAPGNSAAAPEAAANAAATPPAAAKAESATAEPSPPSTKKAARESRADSKPEDAADPNVKDPNVKDPNVTDPNIEERAPTPPRQARVIAKPSAAQPFDQVAEAEKYIYGRGTRQDCDRGLRMLQPAAEHANSKAMISLGALYSTGVCTPRDLPTAYRWFALALRKDPDNQPLQENLQRLWGQMTQPERQLAVKLSQ